MRLGPRRQAPSWAVCRSAPGGGAAIGSTESILPSACLPERTLDDRVRAACGTPNRAALRRAPERSARSGVPSSDARSAPVRLHSSTAALAASSLRWPRSRASSSPHLGEASRGASARSIRGDDDRLHSAPTKERRHSERRTSRESSFTRSPANDRPCRGRCGRVCRTPSEGGRFARSRATPFRSEERLRGWKAPVRRRTRPARRHGSSSSFSPS